MGETDSVDALDLFIEELEDDFLQFQVNAVKKLATVAVALDVEKTRLELIPYLEKFLDSQFSHDEVLLSLAEELERFVPFVGGTEHVGHVLKLLQKLCNADETSVRERAVKSTVSIASTLNKEQLENHVVPIIKELANQEWFPSKCAASGIISICYPNVSPEYQQQLKELFRVLIQDESPMVRRAAALNISNIVELADVETIKAEFIPILDNLIKDPQDTIRAIGVTVAISIATRLGPAENEEFILNPIKELAASPSWRVRCAVAIQIPEIQRALGPDITKQHLLPVYQNLAIEDEGPVREEAAKNLMLFCCILKEYYRDANDIEGFEKVFEEVIMPIVKRLYGDPVENVRSDIALNLMQLVALTNSETARKEVIVLVKDSIEHEQYPKVKENLAKNLGALISLMGMSDGLESIQKLMEDLIYKSDCRWRIRRDILLPFAHICKQIDKDFFDENLKDIYIRLLYDPVMAIRRTAPLILPILMKHFGNNWAYNFVPLGLAFGKDVHYLFRYIPLYCIDEIVNPTLDVHILAGKPVRYLEPLKDLCESSKEDVQKKARKIIVRAFKLHEILKQALNELWVSKYLELIDTEDYPSDKVQVYAEETFDALVASEKYAITDVTENDLSDDEDDKCYLIGVLYLCNRYFFGVIQELLNDPIENVPVRAKYTLRKMISYVASLDSQFKEPWVKELFSEMGEEVSRIGDEIKSKLSASNRTLNDEEEKIDLKKPDEEIKNESAEVSVTADTKVEENSNQDDNTNMETEITEILDSKLNALNE